jgi:hypothetical protein
MTHLFTRRRFLQAGTAGAAMGFTLGRRPARAAATTRSTLGRAQVVVRPDLRDATSRKDFEIIRITTEREVPSSHVYMEAQIFTPDSKRFVLHRSATPHDSDKNDPRHQYLLCDIEDHFALRPLTDEIGATGPSVSPDGRCLYYFVDQTEVGGGKLTLKRVNLDGTDRQTILVLDHPLPGTKFRPSGIYPLSTISSDGRRLAISAFLGDGTMAGATFGLMVFDVRQASVELVLQGPTWRNVHPQFCRSTDPELKRDILIQENHGVEGDAQGRFTRSTDRKGCDVHVIRDDGTNLRDLPWGRDSNERCQGHQCWRGQTDWAITSTGLITPPEVRELIESRPLPHVGHIGLATPGGVRNVLSREFANPCFCHFGVDIAASRLISDAGCPYGPQARVYVARLGAPGKDPLTDFTCVACPKTSTNAHIHPFLSPDGRMGFFNSDESGLLQAYMVRGFA